MYSFCSSDALKKPQLASESGASGSSRCMARRARGCAIGIHSAPGGTMRRSRVQDPLRVTRGAALEAGLRLGPGRAKHLGVDGERAREAREADVVALEAARDDAGEAGGDEVAGARRRRHQARNGPVAQRHPPYLGSLLVVGDPRGAGDLGAASLVVVAAELDGARRAARLEGQRHLLARQSGARRVGGARGVAPPGRVAAPRARAAPAGGDRWRGPAACRCASCASRPGCRCGRAHRRRAGRSAAAPRSRRSRRRDRPASRTRDRRAAAGDRAG